MQPKLFYNQVVSNFHLARSAENGSISFVKLTKVLLRNRNPATFTTRSKKQDWARFLEDFAALPVKEQQLGRVLFKRKIVQKHRKRKLLRCLALHGTECAGNGSRRL